MNSTWTSEILCDALRPLLTRMPRARGRLLSSLGGGLNKHWSEPRRAWRCIYDSSVGAWLVLDIRDGMERAYYYCLAHDFIHPAIINSLLSPGDAYIDIGANIGLHTLRAARHVQPGGHVYAFEANPFTAARLRAHAAINRLSNVTVFDVALSDHPGQATLKPGAEPHAGAMTLSAHGRGEGHEVPLVPGDEILGAIKPQGRVLVKLDVEGHELHVLRGLRRWLAANQPTVVMELTPEWLQSPDEVIGFFTELGYHGYRPLLRRSLRGTARFHFKPFIRPEAFQEDILWLHGNQAPPAEISYNPAA